jgi:hypothetical protein
VKENELKICCDMPQLPLTGIVETRNAYRILARKSVGK